MDTAFPEKLSPGTVIGSWQVTSGAGRGAYGAVYRAVKVGQEEAGWVALKVALRSREERFEREAEVLSRIGHPSVPRLLAQGQWKAGRWRVPHPYLVMEWVEGTPLYPWAWVQSPSSRQVLQLLVQLCRALEAVHAAKCLHRDVKGANVLIGPDGKATLVDFGSGTYPEAPPLTEAPLAPGTRPYRSPQALIYARAHPRDGARYIARPEDDVYALGVTAYRMLTGVYPPLATDLEAGQGGRQKDRPVRQPPHLRVRQIIPELSVLIERMLAEKPSERGSARELADALEAVAVRAGPEADRLLGTSVAFRPEVAVVPEPFGRRSQGRAGLMGAVLACIVMGLATQRVSGQSWMASPEAVQPDAGTVGLADASMTPEALAAAARLEEAAQPKEIVALDVHAPCEDDGFEWDGKCLLPVKARLRPNTSKYP
ncbi:Serine/threonine protein kinase [Stigmatella aurantiaca]|uniref:Serine/threonine protein kinase n=1 Tax=Stigmatella aurantiaca TaxID=41 RepID=A0A1H8BUW1_STIAU|nr:serine/threonine-protein kinase [Stigmatella aurantiaca]SEM86650.1 Serine/threonine protein kinase [Stigmatella aurantiaca]